MSIGQRILSNWTTLTRWPGGKWVFSRLIGFLVPYSGTISANVCELKQGYARVDLADRRCVRNHLGSIHAIALANLGELTSGLAVLTGLPKGSRGILIGLEVEYFKKARGRLTCTAKAKPISPTSNEEHHVYAVIADESGDEVAAVNVLWMLGPEKKHGGA